ncbi:MAG: DNA gyrase/topoisomerase IV subunit A [Bacteroidales bacterium]|nr:DNA gyrase/topoisomerase IV subunit A [Bacteroidales bacterium]
MEENLPIIPDEPTEPEAQAVEQHDLHRVTPLTGMYENWFLDYASYVILERAVPELLDGLKPVQRRLLHAMYELEDGRYNKVANIIGHTMKYHPHGDASIGDALVQMGQKELMIDTQGNWGNVLTGDSAAAPRYIEARLSKFALEVAFNPKNTKWKPSYDGRNNEPVALPMKFPLLLASGVEGIAVGLASKILPHNFIELIDASIKILKGEDFQIFPDFLTGGLADFSKYSKGLRGGKVRVRARISKIDKKTLAITELPFATTTGSLIDTIIAANDKGKIKIRKIDDNTSENVEILIHLQPGVSPDTTIDALYAFTSCEISISTNSCVIYEGKPQFLSVNDLLKISTNNTLSLLRGELQIRKDDLLEKLHFASLEKIFIEKRIYRRIEESETWQEVIDAIDKGLKPHTKQFIREVTTNDIIRLTEIQIKRISKYNSFKADEEIKRLQDELSEVQHGLDNLVEFAIDYFKRILKKYGKGRERRTEIRNFDVIEAAAVAAATQKLYVNREEGFAGSSLKKDEFVCECSDIDDIIAFRDDGTFLVTKVADKVFMGKNIIHIDVFKRNDERTIYNMVYREGKNGNAFIKRFAVLGITRDKEYDLTSGKPNSKVLYFTANPNGEAETIKVFLKPKPKLKKLSFEFDFSTLAIKGRNSKGNILNRNPVQKIVKSEEGISTLGARSIWFDDTVRRLNTDARGKYLGEFGSDDRILTIMSSGTYLHTGYDLSLHFDEDLAHIEKHNNGKILTVIYYNGVKQNYFLKRFIVEPADKKVLFVPEEEGSRLVAFTLRSEPRVQVEFDKKLNPKLLEDELIAANEFVEVMGVKAIGKRISRHVVKKVGFVEEAKAEAEAEEEQPEEVAGEFEEEAKAEEEQTVDVDGEAKAKAEEEQPEEVAGVEGKAKAEEEKLISEGEIGLAGVVGEPKEVVKEKKPGKTKDKNQEKKDEEPKPADEPKLPENISLTPPRPKEDNKQMTLEF